MGPLFFILLGITVLFFLVLGVRELFSKKMKSKICAICAAVSLTWIVLLVLFWLGWFADKVILGLLIGMTSLGVFYLWEKKVGERMKVFRLPLLLSLILAGYTLIEGFSYGFDVLVFLGIVWVLFLAVYVYGSDSKTGGIVRKLVECCKGW